MIDRQLDTTIIVNINPENGPDITATNGIITEMSIAHRIGHI